MSKCANTAGLCGGGGGNGGGGGPGPTNSSSRSGTGPGGGSGPGPSSCGVHERSGRGEQGNVEDSAASPKKWRRRAGCGAVPIRTDPGYVREMR
ncbi:hypothetical protein CHLRE_03g161976v5 [Chlamydomonas reinhardtii]|uniref:Uncharacterized protein n=1 Tax=Chlamydomonas reinhardtii TaxID=3055 RepID=A0A2K3DWG8_CHLRE|nr:uncharacterized protein CHLRE_03g161976v5 [Chlamydomonas reinhardtii]PNW84875.1 hypothetical protein CHLRE_03g161976v5 [Chlamydomonas reinhardtii]